MSVLKNMLMLAFEPTLATLPFARRYETVNAYSIFRFKPMQNLSLGVSRFIIACSRNLLRDSSRKICTQKQFLVSFKRSSPGKGLVFSIIK